MLGNFSYYNPTKLYFGDESLNYLKDELKGYGPVVLLNYGSGSVKRNGIYDQVVAILKEAGKISLKSPIGAALMGKKVGEIAEAQVPSGILRLRIESITLN